jgi:hypothetical protein
MNRDELIIWDAERFGVPDSFEQAMGMAVALTKQPETKISDKLLAFAQYVVPQLQGALDGEDLYPFEEMISEIKDNQYAAFSLYMPEYNWQLALNLLVSAANNYGFVVFYQEAVMAFAPPDRIFPQQAENKWNSIKSFLASSQFPTSIKQFKKWFAPSLDAMFSQHGFVIGDVDEVDTSSSYWTVVYTKATTIGVQDIKIYCQKVHNGFDVSIWPSMKVDYLSNIYNGFNFDSDFNKPRHKPRHKDGTLKNFIFWDDFIIGILKIPSNDMVVCNQISALRLINIVNSTLMTIFESAKTLKGLDEVMNGNSHPYFKEAVHNGWQKPYCLIVARLVNNPSFEQLAIDLLETKRGSDSLRKCWPQFVKFLREIIDPDLFFKDFACLKAEKKRVEDLRVQEIQAHFNPKNHDELMALASQWQDPDTGLIWQRHCLGQHWQDGQVVGTARVLKWKAAQDAVKKIKGFAWRIPTVDELETMMSNQMTSITEEMSVFGKKDQRLVNGTFWALLLSPYTYPYEDYESCVVYFEQGAATSKGYGNDGCVLLVRSSQDM